MDTLAFHPLNLLKGFRVKTVTAVIIISSHSLYQTIVLSTDNLLLNHHTQLDHNHHNPYIP